MTDFDCILQLMGKDAKTELRDYLIYLVKDEIKQLFEDGWVFPTDAFREFVQILVEEIEEELREEYKEQIKTVLKRELLKSLQMKGADDEQGV